MQINVMQWKSTKGAVSDVLASRGRWLRKQRHIKVAFLAVPTPILMHHQEVWSPNRTNYFPSAQILLASGLQARLRQENISHAVEIQDYKVIAPDRSWDDELIEYGFLQYGDLALYKYFAGDKMGEIEERCADCGIVCLTANFTFEANSIKHTIAAIRRGNPNALIMVGGRDASARPEYFNSLGADIVGIGDADSALPEFVVRLYRDEDLGDLVSGIRLDGGRMMFTKMKDIVAPDFSLLDGTLHWYKESGGGGFLDSITSRGSVAYYESSRGCDRDCSFCTEAKTKRTENDLELFARDVDWYAENDVRTMMLSDDNLLQRVNKRDGEETLIRMFEILQEKEMVWEFPIGIEIGRLMSKGGDTRDTLINTMFWNNRNKDDYHGAFRALIPFENVLSDSVADNHQLGKMRTMKENFTVLQRLIDTGVPQLNLALIMGYHTDTQESVQTMIDRLEDVQSIVEEENEEMHGPIRTGVNYSAFCVTPLPGTPFYFEMEAAGRIKYSIEEHPELWNLYTSVLTGDTFEPEDVTRNRKEILAATGSKQSSGKVQLHQEQDETPAQIAV